MWEIIIGLQWLILLRLHGAMLWTPEISTTWASITPFLAIPVYELEEYHKVLSEPAPANSAEEAAQVCLLCEARGGPPWTALASMASILYERWAMLQPPSGRFGFDFLRDMSPSHIVEQLRQARTTSGGGTRSTGGWRPYYMDLYLNGVDLAQVHSLLEYRLLRYEAWLQGKMFNKSSFVVHGCPSFCAKAASALPDRAVASFSSSASSTDAIPMASAMMRPTTARI